MNQRVLLSPPDVGPAERDAVAAALASGWIAPLGPEVDAFEREMAARCHVEHALALASGTAALHLGLLGLGVGPGTSVVTSSMTFAATANAIVYTGADPVFVDSEPASGNIDIDLLERAIIRLRRAGTVVSAILPVDLLGRAVDYSSILEIARRFEIPVLADAAESLGATHRMQPAGSLAAASAVSFNGNKIMTTSGGGMLLSDDEALIAHARYLSTQARQPVPHYEHTDIGFNYRLSNLLAALGRAQLGRLDEMLLRRRAIRERYRALLASVPGVRIFQGEDDAEDNCWLTAIVVDEHVAGISAAGLMARLDADGIESRPLWKPMHLQPVFARSRRFVSGVSEYLFTHGVALPSGSSLTDAEIDRVLSSLRAAFAPTSRVRG